jgi:alkylation response protein AidB-like acyl-CoA dehydrogenase
MDFGLSEVGEILKKSARDFLAAECPKSYVIEMAKDEKGYRPEMWRKIAGLGWMGLVFPDEYGGGGGSFIDLVVLLDEMGRACLPGPFFSTVVLGGMTILDAGDEEQKKELLPLIAQGKLIVTLAMLEPHSTYVAESVNMEAIDTGDSYILSGAKLFVPDAHIADYIICVVRTKEGSTGEDGISLFLVDAKSVGVEIILLKTLAGDKQCEVIFNKVKVPKKNLLGELNRGWSYVQKMMQRAALGKCAEMIGGAQQVQEMTVDYVKQRVQFGRPIGSFQYIQGYCVQILTDAETSRFITYEAAWKMSEGLSCSREVSMAKAWVSDAYKRITALGHQSIGGMAYMEDHDMHLYLKQAKTAELAFGDADVHREFLAQEMGL